MASGHSSYPPETEPPTSGDTGERVLELERRIETLQTELSRLRARKLQPGERDAGLGSLLTERQALADEVERLAHVGSWLWDVRSGEVAWSSELYRILGYDPDREPPSVELFFGAIHPEDREAIQAASARSAATGYTEPGTRCRVLRSDGSVRQIVLMGTAIRDQEGALIRIVGAALDVTDLVATETELRKTAELFSEAQRIASLGSWNFRRDLGDIEWSDTMFRILGIPAGSPLTPELFMSRVHPDDRERVATLPQQVERHQALLPAEFRVVWPDGSLRHVSVEARLTRDESGKPVRFLGTLQDITARKQLEEQLRHSQKMEAVGTLAGGVAHDFNNYLVVIHGNVDLLKTTLPPGGPEHDMLEEIARAAGRCATLTRQLLAFSRRHAPSPRLVDVCQIVTESGSMLRRLLGEHIELVVTTEPDVGPVRADPAHIEQIIVNLAVNARDAMPTGGVLTIEAGTCYVDPDFASLRPRLTPGMYALLSVTDTGVGMPDEVKARIFEPFFTTKEPGRGTGLGLAIVYGIVQQTGGHIELASQRGRGTSFAVYLPMQPGGVEAARTLDPPAPASRGETVLIAEDEPQVRRLAKTVLERAGYRVVDAEDGVTALELGLGLSAVELLVTDVTMPRLGGPELARKLRARHPGLRVLFMSGYPDAEPMDGEFGGSDGAIVSKPFTTRQLLQRVRELLDQESS